MTSVFTIFFSLLFCTFFSSAAWAQFAGAESLLKEGRTDVFCQPGSWYSALKSTGKSVCLNNDFIAGPFPDGRLQVLISDTPNHSSGCFSGSSFDLKYGVCTDADNAYGGVNNVILWSYHDYGEGISVLDNLNEQSSTGHVWAEPALQPFD